MFNMIKIYVTCIASVLGLYVFTGCQTSPSSSEYGPKMFQGQEYTAVIVAYQPEMFALLEAIDNDPDAKITDTVSFKGIQYSLGTYNDEPILVFATGMSIANAALSMQMALDYFPVDEVVYMGIAGAVNPKWQPGDVIVPERWYYHDESVYSNPDPEVAGAYVLPDYYRACPNNRSRQC